MPERDGITVIRVTTPTFVATLSVRRGRVVARSAALLPWVALDEPVGPVLVRLEQTHGWRIVDRPPEPA